MWGWPHEWRDSLWMAVWPLIDDMHSAPCMAEFLTSICVGVVDRRGSFPLIWEWSPPSKKEGRRRRPKTAVSSGKNCRFFRNVSS